MGREHVKGDLVSRSEARAENARVDIDPIKLKKCVREICKSFDQKGDRLPPAQFRKQVEIEAGLPENTLGAFQPIIEQIRKKENAWIEKTEQDEVDLLYTQRRISEVRDIGLSPSEAQKRHRAKRLNGKPGNMTSFGKEKAALNNKYRWRRPSKELPQPTTRAKERNKRYSLVLGHSAEEVIRKRNQQFMEEDKKRRALRAKQKERKANGGPYAIVHRKKAKAKSKEKAPGSPAKDEWYSDKSTRFSSLYKFFSRQKAPSIHPNANADGQTDEDGQAVVPAPQSEPKAKRGGAKGPPAMTMHDYTITPPCEWR